MKKIQSFFVLAGCLVMLSCTDHDIENPDSACSRVDGSARDYPCEFEIVKAEFTNKLDLNDVVATVTPQNRKVTLPVSAGWSFFHPSPGYADVTFKVLLHIKRVSNPSFSSSNQYVIPFVTSHISDLEAHLGISQFPPIYPPSPKTISVGVGETFVTVVDVFYHSKEDLQQPGNMVVYSDVAGNMAYLIYNMKTATMLAAPPYNYQNIFDLAEGHIIIEPTLIE